MTRRLHIDLQRVSSAY
ncbi:putative leader peptide [Streptomyces sp. NPDC057927]